MKEEVDTRLLPWLIEENIRQKHPRLTDLLQKLGVKIVEEDKTLYAWGWHRPNYDPEYIVTVWAEEVYVDQQGGWESRISLIPSGDPKYNNEQRQRERDRIAILEKLRETKCDCRVILLINRHSREADVAGEAEMRVLDDVYWHVDIPYGSYTGKLRRGLKLAEKTGQESGLDKGQSSNENEPNLQFPDQETRDLVEQAAIEHAKEVYAEYGLVRSVERENLGYDLEVRDEVSDDIKLKVEVKGTASEVEHFYLTRNEDREARADPKRWRLAVVVDALHDPALQEYTFEDMEKRFARSALVWHCVPQRK